MLRKKGGGFLRRGSEWGGKRVLLMADEGSMSILGGKKPRISRKKPGNSGVNFIKVQLLGKGEKEREKSCSQRPRGSMQ